MLQHDESVTEVQPEDRLICRDHGDVGSYADFEPSIHKDAVEFARAHIQKIIDGDDTD